MQFPLIRLLGLAATLLIASQAHATAIVPGDYFLLDHPDSALPAPYGLRLDVLDPPVGNGPTFSTEVGGARVVLSWDGSGTATISGTVYNNDTGNLWTVDQTLTGVSPIGSGATAGFSATGGTLTITVASQDVALYGANQFVFGSGLMAGKAFVARGDSYRCGSHPDCGPGVARGWLTLDGASGNTTDDWIVQLSPVPLPAAVWMLLAGLGGFAATARKKS